MHMAGPARRRPGTGACVQMVKGEKRNERARRDAESLAACSIAGVKLSDAIASAASVCFCSVRVMDGAQKERRERGDKTSIHDRGRARSSSTPARHEAVQMRCFRAMALLIRTPSPVATVEEERERVGVSEEEMRGYVAGWMDVLRNVQQDIRMVVSDDGAVFHLLLVTKFPARPPTHHIFPSFLFFFCSLLL